MSTADLTPVTLRLYLGQPYRYHHVDASGSRVEASLYAPLFFVYHGRTDTDMVCYVGLDGEDQGQRFVCELSDWELRFERVVEKKQATQKRVAGAYNAGSGV